MKSLRTLHVIIILATSATRLFGQQELPIELPGTDILADSIDASYMRPIESPILTPTRSDNAILREVESTLNMPSIFSPRPADYTPRSVTAPGVAAFRLWDGASVAASGQTVSLPGMGAIERGMLTLVQQAGPLTFTAYTSASHYGYFRGMQTAFGFGGSIDWRISPRWSLTLFGAYSTPLHPLTPGMAGYMDTSRFGGYASYDINEHWGISVGAQATRSLVTNRWEAQPIVMPYYKINDKAAIQVDVGGILYNAIKDYSESRSGHRANPTFGPPVGGPPPVAPHPGR